MGIATRKEKEISMKLFVVLTRTLDAIKKSVEKDIRSYGLNTTEFAVLEFIYSKGDQPIQKIGEKVLISSSSITYVVDKLEKKNFLKRVPSPEDRRITFASITEEGKRFMDDIFPQHQETIARIMGDLPLEEKEVLLTQLKKLGFHAKEV